MNSAASEAQEILSLRGRTDSADELYEMIKAKTAVTEAAMKIGAIIGKGKTDEIEALGSFGKTFSVLFALRDEFIDVFEVDEVVNRYKNECLPLPILVTFKDPKQAKRITQLLSKQKITKKEFEDLVDLVIESKETCELKQEMLSMVKAEEHNLRGMKLHQNDFKVLLNATVKGI